MLLMHFDLLFCRIIKLDLHTTFPTCDYAQWPPKLLMLMSIRPCHIGLKPYVIIFLRSRSNCQTADHHFKIRSKNKNTTFFTLLGNLMISSWLNLELKLYKYRFVWKKTTRIILESRFGSCWPMAMIRKTKLSDLLLVKIILIKDFDKSMII